MIVTDATAQVRRLRGVTWEWRDDAPAEAHEQPGRGVIAQEVEAVFPDLVETGPDGRKRVEYDGLVAPLCRAVGELLMRVGSRAPELVSLAAERSAETLLDADAVERVFPELVSTDLDGERVVAYHGLIGPLIEAVKELDRRLTALEDART